MKNLTKKDKTLIIDKIIDEMEFAEKNLSELGFSWAEKCSGTRCGNFNELTIYDVNLLQEKYNNNYELSDYFDRNPNEFFPLKKIKLVDDYYNKEYVCEFENVTWYGVSTKRSKRKFEFSNDGNIYYEKKWIGTLNQRRRKGISYNLSYNVLNNNYEIEYYDENCINNEFNDVTMCYEDNKMVKLLNNISIIEDFDLEKKKVDVLESRKRGRYSISTELSMDLNFDNSINSIKLVSNIEKEREEGIKKWIFNIDSCGLKVQCIENDKIVDVLKNPKLIEMMVRLICDGQEEKKPELKIIRECLESFLETSNEFIYKKNIELQDFKCDFNSLNDVDNKIIDSIKQIQGEIPLKGFNERFNNQLAKHKQKVV